MPFVVHHGSSAYSTVNNYLSGVFHRSSVSLQDPFADSSDPAFSRRNTMTPNSGYQSGMSTPEMPGRMGPYEPNKDPFSGMRKGKNFHFGLCFFHF